jgi:hypothetical protein
MRMSKKPNVPMNHAITTCRHKVDKEKFNEGWDRIWGKKEDPHEAEMAKYRKAVNKRLREFEDEAIIECLISDDS